MINLTIHLYTIDELRGRTLLQAMNAASSFYRSLIRMSDCRSSAEYHDKVRRASSARWVTSATKTDGILFTLDGTMIRPDRHIEDRGIPEDMNKPIPGEAANETTYWADVLGERYVLYKKPHVTEFKIKEA